MLGKTNSNRKTKFIFIVLTPLLIYIGLFFYWPLIYNFIISFHKTNLLTTFKWTGLSNYISLFKSNLFWKSLLNNFKYMIIWIVGGISLAIIFSELIFRCTPIFKKIFTFLFFVPVVTSMVASALVWKLLYFPETGLISRVFEFLGFGAQSFLQDPEIALLCIIFFNIWKDLGLMMVILLAAMDQIPKTYYEAAEIDGASKFTTFLKIRLPLIFPQIFFLIVIYSINAIRVFQQIYLMTPPPGGGPARSTYVINLLMYHSSFRDLNFGYGASVASVTFVMLFIFVLIQIKLNLKNSQQ